MSTLRTPEQLVREWADHCNRFGKSNDEAAAIVFEALEQIASGLPRVRIVKRAAKSRDIARKALKSLEAGQ